VGTYLADAPQRSKREGRDDTGLAARTYSAPVPQLTVGHDADGGRSSKSPIALTGPTRDLNGPTLPPGGFDLQERLEFAGKIGGFRHIYETHVVKCGEPS